MKSDRFGFGSVELNLIRNCRVCFWVFDVLVVLVVFVFVCVVKFFVL